MNKKQTDQICEKCYSHIITYRENNKIISECSYCGSVPEDINLQLIDLEDDRYEQ